MDAWARLLRSHAALARLFSVALATEHGLSINDYEALLLLSRADGERLRRVDLAQRLQLTASGVTRLLDGLQDGGLVEKAECKGDARVTYAVLTVEGRERLESASKAHAEVVRTLFGERFTCDELGQLAELLGRLPGGDVSGGSCRSGVDAAHA